MKQNIKRINHCAIFVNPENFDKTVQSLERILEIQFEHCTRHDLKVRIAVDHHNSGLEVLAPTTPDSPVADIIRERGEGHICIVVGVKDCDAAAARAVKEGHSLIPEVGLDGSEPWAHRYKTFREIGVPIGQLYLSLGQIEPKNPD